MDTNGLDYTKKTDTGKENGLPKSTAPIAARPEQGDLKTMVVEYVLFFTKIKKIFYFILIEVQV